jgi:hypothetical protein
MTDSELWISRVLASSGLDTKTISILIDAGPQHVQASVDMVVEQSDSSALSWVLPTAASSKRRQTFVNSLPRISKGEQLMELLPWINVMTSSRFRTLRVLSTIATMQTVEVILRNMVLDGGDSKDRKQLLIFCGRIFSQICIPRSRDTFPVIRQIVGEYICRWAYVRSEVLTSSVFSPHREIIDCLKDLLIDDESDVRCEVMKGLCTLLSDIHETKSQLTENFVRLVLKAFLVRCADSRTERTRESELLVHAELIKMLVIGSSGRLLDTLEEFEEVYQTLWDRMLPIQVRSVIAKMVALYVFSTNIYRTEFIEFGRGADMMLAFVDQFKPDSSAGQDCDHFPVFRAFLEGLDQPSLQGFLIALSDRTELKYSNKLVEAIASYAVENTFFGLTIETALAQAATRDPHILNAIVLLYGMGSITSEKCREVMRLIPEAVATRNDSCYTTKYLAFKLWSLLAARDQDQAIALERFSVTLESMILSESGRMALHALQSAVERPLSDASICDRLFDLVLHGNLASVADLICSLDILFIQATKGDTMVSQRLADVLSRVKTETESDKRRDALIVDFFCRYRIASLEGKIVSKQRKGHVDVAVSSSFVDGMSACSHIMIQLLQHGDVEDSFIRIIE